VSKASGLAERVERVEASIEDRLYVELSLHDLGRSKRGREGLFSLLYDLSWNHKVRVEAAHCLVAVEADVDCAVVKYVFGGLTMVCWHAFRLPVREGERAYLIRRVFEVEGPFEELDDEIASFTVEEGSTKLARRVVERVVEDVERVRKSAGIEGPIDLWGAASAIAYVLSEAPLKLVLDP